MIYMSKDKILTETIYTNTYLTDTKDEDLPDNVATVHTRYMKP